MNHTRNQTDRKQTRAILLRRLAESQRAAADAAEALAELEEHDPERRYVSQLDGERPDGYVGDGTRRGNQRAAQRLLRVFRENREELGVVERGKARLVPVEKWDAFVRARGERRVALRLVTSTPPAAADSLRDALGLVRGAR